MTDEQKSENIEEEQKLNEEAVTEQENKAEETPADEPQKAEASDTSAELEKLKDQYLRTLAEYDNYRKRTTKEKEQAFGRGVSHAIEAILPVVDTFERALSAAKDPDDSFVKGVQMTYQQMMTALKSIGITPIDCLGAQFDPHYHNAVMHVEDEAYGENEIVQVLVTGYMYNDTLLRAAMVKVAN